MTIKEFFYESSEDIIRVEAEGFDQVTQPGSCNERYSVVWRWVYLSRFSGFQISNLQYARGYPPFEIYIAQRGQPHRFIEGYTPQGAEAALLVHDVNGELVVPNGYDRPGSWRRGPAWPAWYRIRRSSTAYPTHHSSGAPAGWMVATGEQFSNPHVQHNGGVDFYIPPGVPLDDCEGGCTTNFYRGSSIFYSIANCPDISEGNPPGHDCERCCDALLPLLRNIQL